MCARYELSSNARELMERFGLEIPPPLPNQSEIRPTDVSAVLTRDGAESLPWGPKAPWDGKPLINARAETLTEKVTFRPWLENRCLIPADAYFEWRKTETGAKLKNRVSLASHAPFAFAGLIDRTADQSAFTIITCPPADPIRHIHSRMPVILAQDAQDAWLDGSLPFAEVADRLTPFTAEPLEAVEDAPPPPAQADLFG